MTITPESKKKIFIGLLIAVCFFAFEFYIPNSFGFKPQVTYIVQKGMGNGDIATDLQKQGIIKSSFFFKVYVVLFGEVSKLKAGTYSLSPSMSIAQIVRKIATGDVIKNNITLIEGWDLQDIGTYLEAKKIMTSAEFLIAVKNSPQDFDFLKDKPQKMNLEGYIFPDTYEISQGQTPEGLVKTILENFDKKLTPDLRKEIAAQKKTIFQIITMASMIEKEVQTMEDKKIVSGILWKRIKEGMPLQIDATINYITGKSDVSVVKKDTEIDSHYNTYKYYGLPQGPICNPGIDSIIAAIYPEKSDYWYYLSADHTGKTIFSKTLEDHNAAVAKYLKP